MRATTIGFNTEYADEEPSLDDVNSLSGLAFLEFGAPWCRHCQASLDATKKIIDEHSGVFHVKVFDGKGKRLGRQFGIKRWPTLIALIDGKEVGRIVRFTSSNKVRELFSSL